ncbi:MAG: hypothetical protein EXR55_05035 [Dehalococcoidia bacterium]|nr:hypothetical protein [Dehalococcoidia bacterium]
MTLQLLRAVAIGLVLLEFTALGVRATAADEPAPGALPVMAGLRDDVLVPELPPWVSSAPVVGSSHNDLAPGFLETSEYMIGSVAVGALFLESTGAIDPSTENWTATEKSFALQKLQAALDWWAAQEPAARLTFVTEVISEVPISYEPIARAHTDNPLWVGEAMERMGVPASRYSDWGNRAYLGQAYGYVNDLRQRKGTNWAFSILFVRDVNDPDHLFANQQSAFARLGGPYQVNPYHSDGWGPENLHRVIAHEMGHIFYATDTYDNTTESSGYFNTRDVDGGFGLMNRNELFLPNASRLQVGWRDTDGDGILDPADTTPSVSLVAQGPGPTDRTTLEYRGTAQEVPLTNLNPWGSQRSVSVNRIGSVSYRVDGGSWATATPLDGQFDSAREEFSFTLSGLAPAQHTIEVRATNSVGSPTAQPAQETLLVTHIVVSDATVSTSRANVGSAQQVHLRLRWAHDGSPVPSGTVSLAGGSAVPIAPSGDATIPMTSAMVERTTWTVEARSGNIQRTVLTASAPAIIWDRVRVTEVVPSRLRADVGTVQAVLARAVLEYDGTPLGPGDVLSINDLPAAWDPSAAAFRLEETKAEVTKVSFTVTAARQGLHGISALSNPIGVVSIIWDEIRVDLASDRERVNVGSAAPLSINATHAFDGAPFQGQVLLNGPTQREAIGVWEFQAQKIEDPTFGLTRFVTDRVPVVWDRVAIALVSDLERVQVGSEAPLHSSTRYKYDGTLFLGSIDLDSDPVQQDLGPQVFTVSAIADSQYGLTAFAANNVTVTFDRIQAAQRFSTTIPGRVSARGSLTFASDSVPVEGAVVSLGDATAPTDASGLYELGYETWLPWSTVSLTVTKNGFDPIQGEFSGFMLGNLLAEAGLVLALAAAGALLFRRMRARRNAP